MSHFFVNVSSTALKDQLERSGLKRPKNSLNALDLIPKETLAAIMMDLYEHFLEQVEILNLPEYFVKYATSKYEFTYQSNRFAWSLEYSLNVHAKIYREPKIFQFFFAEEDPRELLLLYRRARRVMAQHFHGDADGKMYDIESLELELDHWVILANRVFDTSEYNKAIESLNYAIVQESTHSNERLLKKTINAIAFIQLCMLEYMRQKSEGKEHNLGSTAKKSSPATGHKRTLSATPTPGYVKLGGGMILKEGSSRHSAHNDDNVAKDYSYQTPNKGMTFNDGSPDFSKMRSISPIKATASNSKDLYELRREKKFLTTELNSQTHERKTVQANLEKAVESYIDLSNKHDKLVDFVREMQLDQQKSAIVRDQKMRQTINKVTDYKNFEKRHAEKLMPLGLLNKNETFSNLLDHAKQVKTPPK